MSDMDVGVVDVRIFWGPSARSRSVSTHPPLDEDWPPGLVVVHRVVSWGPARASRQRLPIPQSPDGEAGKDHLAAQRLMDAFDEYMAKNLVDPAWKKTNDVWVTPVCEGVAAVAERLSSFHDQWHDLVLGQRIKDLTGATLLSDIATELALPGDAWFAGIKRTVQVGGILFGLASGQPLLVNACLKSLVHDDILKAVSRGIGNLLCNTLEPAGAFERDLETTRTRAELEQQARELQELIEIARDKQKERDEPEYEDLEYCNESLWPDQDEKDFEYHELPDMNNTVAAGKDPSSLENQAAQTDEQPGQTTGRNDNAQGRD